MKLHRVTLVLLLSIGVLFPLTWHFILLDVWIQSIPELDRDIGIGIGVFLGYIVSIFVMATCGFLVVLCSMLLGMKSIFYKVVCLVGVIEVLIPSTILIVTYFE